MAATNFKTENNTFRKLIGNGLSYRIPRFQRDYSWTDEEWEDLWQDLLGTLQPDGEPVHYLGYLVLQSPDDKTFEVIDGQQRLTTVTIVILAISCATWNRISIRAAFTDKTIRTTQSRNNRVVRFILCALERHLVPDHDDDVTSDNHPALQVMGRSRQGMTRPFVCRGDDDQVYFVKGAGAGRRSQCLTFLVTWFGGLITQNA